MINLFVSDLSLLFSNVATLYFENFRPSVFPSVRNGMGEAWISLLLFKKDVRFFFVKFPLIYKKLFYKYFSVGVGKATKKHKCM